MLQRLLDRLPERVANRLPHVLGSYFLLLIILWITHLSLARIGLVFLAIGVGLPVVLGCAYVLVRGRTTAGAVWRWIWTHPTPGSLIFCGFVMALVFCVALLMMSVTVDAVLSGSIWIAMSAYLRWKWDGVVQFNSGSAVADSPPRD